MKDFLKLKELLIHGTFLFFFILTTKYLNVNIILSNFYFIYQSLNSFVLVEIIPENLISKQ